MNMPLNLRRRLGRTFDSFVNLLMRPKYIAEALIFNWKLSSTRVKYSKKVKMKSFFEKQYVSKKYKIFWDSSIEDKFLAANYRYRVDSQNKELVFFGKQSSRRWEAISDAISDLSLLNSRDYVIDLGCSSGALVNGIALKFGCNSIGIDINTDNCLDFAKKFKIKKTKFKQLSIEDLFDMKFDSKFKLVLFTYQSHGDIRWLSNKNVQMRFFNWLKHNGQFLIMNDPKNKIAMPFNMLHKLRVLKNADFNTNYLLTIYEII